MTPGRRKTAPCGSDDAWDRFDHAQRFLETAELVLDEKQEGFANVAGALAVLAGIAAADAVCCETLGRRHRGEDHRAAVEIVRGVAHVGVRMATDLGRLLAIKDKASYGSDYLSRADARTAVARARRMVERAATALRIGS